MVRFYIYKFGEFCVLHLPLWLAYCIAMRISDLHYLFSFRDRRSVKNNLKVILQTNEDVSSLARQVFRNFGKYLVDFFRMKKTVNPEYIKKNIKIVNAQRLEEALSRGKGGIIVTAHLGNWEIGSAVMSYLGHSPMAVALPHKERSVNDLFNKQREAWGTQIVQINGAIRKCLETLKENKLIALLADRDFTQTGEIMDFLGKKALIPKGPAIFSGKTGAAIIPSFLLRNPDDTFTLYFEDLILPPEVNEDVVPDQVMFKIMQAYTAVIERTIREHPTQWLMFREFWIK